MPLFQIAQNSHVNDSIKTSPFQALTGRAISLAISLATPPPQNAINLPLQELFSRVLQETMLSKNRSIRIRSCGYTDRILIDLFLVNIFSCNTLENNSWSGKLIAF